MASGSEQEEGRAGQLLRSQIDRNDQSRTGGWLGCVEGTVRVPSDKSRKSQREARGPLAFRGTETLSLKDVTQVVLTISECHPGDWPVKPGEDISAYAQLDVKSSDDHSFSIVSYIGGPEEHSPGSFRLLLPVNVEKRSRILQIIHQISEHGASPKREEFNLVLKEVLSSLHASISDAHALRLGALLGKSVDLSVSSDISP